MLPALPIPLLGTPSPTYPHRLTGTPLAIQGTGLPLPHYLPDFPTGGQRGAIPLPTGHPALPFGASHPPHTDRGGPHWQKGRPSPLPFLPDPLPSFPTPPFFTRPPPRLTRPPFLGGEGENPLEKAVTGHFLPPLPDLPDPSLIPEMEKRKRGRVRDRERGGGRAKGAYKGAKGRVG
jgi:hypothetical protein